MSRTTRKKSPNWCAITASPVKAKSRYRKSPVMMPAIKTSVGPNPWNSAWPTVAKTPGPGVALIMKLTINRVMMVSTLMGRHASLLL